MSSRRTAPAETTSTLTDALRRLDAAEQRLSDSMVASERRIAEFEGQWQARQSRIVQRLRVVDGHVAVLTGNFNASKSAESPKRTDARPPLLGVVGAPADAASMSPMVAN